VTPQHQANQLLTLHQAQRHIKQTDRVLPQDNVSPREFEAQLQVISEIMRRG
jgi:hypothetical protein